MSSRTEALDRNRSMDTLKRILSCITQYKRGVMLSLFLALTTVALTLYVPIPIGWAVDRIVSIDHVNFSGLTTILWKVLGAVGLTTVAQWTIDHINNIVTHKVMKGIRTKAFSHLEILSLNYIDSHPSEGVISQIITDIDQFSEGLLVRFTQLLIGILTIVGILLFMLSIHPTTTLVVVLPTLILLFVANFTIKRTFVMPRHQSTTRGEFTALTDEMLGNMKVVQAFGYQKETQRKSEEINNYSAGYSLRATFSSSITNPATWFVNSTVYAAVGITGAYATIWGFMTVGQLTSFLSYADQYTKSLNEISGVAMEFQSALASVARAFELIDEKVILADKPDAVELEQVDGRVELERVDSFYTSDRKLIEDLNFLIEPGRRVTIVDPTGCGKTTIINLLMCFHDANSGAIRVEGEDIRDVTRKSLRANYGMVLQEIWLESGTIREDIVYRRLDTAEDEVIQAVKGVCVCGFIIRMPEGYGMVVRGDGGNLSQGQRQLLCIARIMLCPPPMLILDEATSSTDIRTETRAQKAFTRMMEGCTNFTVAHCLSTIREAGVILVTRDGHIVEKGKYKELLGKSGFYAEIYNSQSART